MILAVMEIRKIYDSSRAAGTGRRVQGGTGPDPESWKKRREEDERYSRESARFWQQHEDDREVRLGAYYAREHHGIPRLQDGLEPFTNRLLPARDRVRFVEDYDSDGYYIQA